MNLRSLLERYSVDELKAAIKLRGQHGKVEALEAKRDALLKQVARIDRQLSKLDGASGNGAATTASKPVRKQGRRKGYKLSPATRNRMRIAALKRYGNKAKAVEAPKPDRKRRKLSAAGRAAISAAAKARWAKVKAVQAVEAQ